MENAAAPPDSAVQPSRTRSRWVRLAVLAALPFLVAAVACELAARRIEAVLQQIDARDAATGAPPTYLEAIPKNLAAERNCFHLLAAACSRPQLTPAEVEALVGRLTTCQGYEDFDGPPETVKQLEQVAQGQQKLDGRLAQAAASALKSGDAGRAFDVYMAMLRLARQEHEGTLFWYVLCASADTRSKAVEGLALLTAAGSLGDGQRERLDQELALHNDLAVAERRSIAADRRQGLRRFHVIRAGVWGNIPWRMRMVYWMPTRLVELADKQKHAENVESLLEALDGPFSASTAAQARVQSSGTPVHPIASLMVPQVRHIRARVDRSEALVRCLRILIAIRRQPDGDTTRALAALPAETLVDPYTLGKIVVRATPKGPLIYALGENCVDDGGIAKAPSDDVGLSPIP